VDTQGKEYLCGRVEGERESPFFDFQIAFWAGDASFFSIIFRWH
jgi:hypothetical protein